MGELVHSNLYQMRDFFYEVKLSLGDTLFETHFNDVRKKRHYFENKIASMKRDLENFQFYVIHEIKLRNKMIKELNFKENDKPIKEQLELIKRLLRQITTHFGEDESAFKFVLGILKDLNCMKDLSYNSDRALLQFGSRNFVWFIIALEVESKIIRDYEHNNFKKQMEFKKKSLQIKDDKKKLEQLDLEFNSADIDIDLKQDAKVKNILQKSMSYHPSNIHILFRNFKEVLKFSSHGDNSDYFNAEFFVQLLISLIKANPYLLDMTHNIYNGNTLKLEMFRTCNNLDESKKNQFQELIGMIKIDNSPINTENTTSVTETSRITIATFCIFSILFPKYKSEKKSIIEQNPEIFEMNFQPIKSKHQIKHENQTKRKTEKCGLKLREVRDEDKVLYNIKIAKDKFVNNKKKFTGNQYYSVGTIANDTLNPELNVGKKASKRSLIDNVANDKKINKQFKKLQSKKEAVRKAKAEFLKRNKKTKIPKEQSKKNKKASN